MTTPKVREATMTTTPGPRTGHVHQHGGFCVVCGIHMAEARADVDGLVARVTELENALEQERNNRKDQVRRKRVGQATTRALLAGDKAEAPPITKSCRRRSGEPEAEECGLPYGHEPPHHPRAMVEAPDA